MIVLDDDGVFGSEDQANDVFSAPGQRQVPFLRTPYNYSMEKASDATGLRCEDAHLAQQQFAEEDL